MLKANECKQTEIKSTALARKRSRTICYFLLLFAVLAHAKCDEVETKFARQALNTYERSGQLQKLFHQWPE